MTSAPLFTAIVHTYYRPALLRQAVEALQRQTYGNLEIILISNGATPETVEYLHQVSSSDSRVRLVEFAENQFNWNDPLKYVHICLNAALTQATGEYVWVQEDDDFLADDYAEKMVQLFQDNPECTTAAGLPVSIDIHGNVNPGQYQASNSRGRYTPGRVVAEDYLTGNGTMFAAPGAIFTIKRSVLLEAGGYHRGLEASHIYGILPFGVTGFDATALFYWRHHQGQLNLQASGAGWIGIDENLSLLKDWRLEQRWSVFGSAAARGVIRGVRRQVYDHAASRFVRCIYGFAPRPAAHILGKMWFRPYFWYQVISRGVRREYYLEPAFLLLRRPIKWAFRLFPGLAKVSPFMGRLKILANREPT